VTKRVCPYCESSVLEDDEAGTVLRCHACGRSSLPGAAGSPVPEPSGNPLDSSSQGFTHRLRDHRGAPGEVPSWPAAAAAFAASALYYGLLSVLPATGFSELFLERGWVPYVITVISVWALFLLAAKSLRLRRQRRALDRDLVWANAEGRLRPDDAADALLALRREPAEVADSFLAQRIERALRHFQSRRHSVEVVDFLAAESRADEGRVDASYGLVRVFVWAVPTLGFIGTVIGIGAAVAGFSETLEAASSLDGMKESIGLVTGGLGVAFDTTLLALVMSILIMFPASAAQRIEEAFLSDVDDYCSEYLVPRLLDAPSAEADDAVVAALANRLVASMRSAERRER
jgi:biopolymer transport protein ExbB/TolQ